MWLMAWLTSSGETECTAAAGRLGKCTHGLPTFPPSLLWLCRRYLTGHTTRGVWSSYFLVQVPAIIVERIGELTDLLEPLLLGLRAGGTICNGSAHDLHILPAPVLEHTSERTCLALLQVMCYVQALAGCCFPFAAPPDSPQQHAFAGSAAVLAQLKRRKIMVPALLRMAYTVGFETLSAQVRFWLGDVELSAMQGPPVAVRLPCLTGNGHTLSACGLDSTAPLFRPPPRSVCRVSGTHVIAR